MELGGGSGLNNIISSNFLTKELFKRTYIKQLETQISSDSFLSLFIKTQQEKDSARKSSEILMLV